MDLIRGQASEEEESKNFREMNKKLNLYYHRQMVLSYLFPYLNHITISTCFVCLSAGAVWVHLFDRSISLPFLLVFLLTVYRMSFVFVGFRRFLIRWNAV